MKTKHANGKHNGKTSLQDIVLKAATAQKLADAARKHFKTLKADYKAARKGFKQAKKAAKLARKELEAAKQLEASRHAARPRAKTRHVGKRSAHLPTVTPARTAVPSVSIPLPPPPSPEPPASSTTA
jgi:hypothetical protein